jgi:hypothetical protein
MGDGGTFVNDDLGGLSGLSGSDGLGGLGNGGAEIESEVAGLRAAEPIGPQTFGIPGASIEDPAAFQGSSPVGGPASLFNIGGAPIAILGGVFSGGLPIGGPVTQIFRSGAPVPNTLFIATLESSGPIGVFAIGSGGEAIGDVGQGPAPIGPGFEGSMPIGGGF